MVVSTPPQVSLELERFETSYTNLSERFSKTKNDFTKQYCSIYIVRLEKMIDLLQRRITQKWGDSYPVCKLHKLAEETFPKCIVFGTLFKDQKLKPSILKELAEANNLLPQPIYNHFTDESDVLYIEDEQQRYQIEGDMSGKNIVTGVVCALLGSDQNNGKFLVEDYCFADLQQQIPRPLIEKDLYVALVSGLDLAHVEKSALALNMFVDWITGLANGLDVCNITRLIIAGNSINSEVSKHRVKISMTARTTDSLESVEAVKRFDSLLFQLCQSLEVDVMPGEFDPSNYLLPQKPMHHCMFPDSITYKSTNLVSNPYECEIGGLRFLGTSGEPVNDILKFCDIPETIDVLETCMRWAHLVPTAPDTLGCFPFYETDPFIINNCPHVMFAGNQDNYNTKLIKGPENQEVRLICIPKFSKSFTVVLLNLRTLDCTPVSFTEL